MAATIRGSKITRHEHINGIDRSRIMRLQPLQIQPEVGEIVDVYERLDMNGPTRELRTLRAGEDQPQNRNNTVWSFLGQARCIENHWSGGGVGAEPGDDWRRLDYSDFEWIDD